MWTDKLFSRVTRIDEEDNIITIKSNNKDSINFEESVGDNVENAENTGFADQSRNEGQ